MAFSLSTPLPGQRAHPASADWLALHQSQLQVESKGRGRYGHPTRGGFAATRDFVKDAHAASDKSTDADPRLWLTGNAPIHSRPSPPLADPLAFDCPPRVSTFAVE